MARRNTQERFNQISNYFQFSPVAAQRRSPLALGFAKDLHDELRNRLLPDGLLSLPNLKVTVICVEFDTRVLVAPRRLAGCDLYEEQFRRRDGADAGACLTGRTRAFQTARLSEWRGRARINGYLFGRISQ